MAASRQRLVDGCPAGRTDAQVACGWHCHENSWMAAGSLVLEAPGRVENRGVESAQSYGGLADGHQRSDLRPTPTHIVELERLGDEIAELSAHLDAATARLLDLIRDFDAREGW